MNITKNKPLWKPKYWNDLTQEQKDEAFNGIGPEYFPEWLRKMFDNVLYWMGEAAYIHDVEYTYSKIRLLADFRFFVNCCIMAGLDIVRFYFKCIAFVGLVFGGRKAWKESRLKE